MLNIWPSLPSGGDWTNWAPFPVDPPAIPSTSPVGWETIRTYPPPSWFTRKRWFGLPFGRHWVAAAPGAVDPAEMLSIIKVVFGTSRYAAPSCARKNT